MFRGPAIVRVDARNAFGRLGQQPGVNAATNHNQGETPMQSSIRLGRIAGIDIGPHYTWIFAVVLIAWSLAVGYFPDVVPGLGVGAYWALGIIAALMLFVSVLLHELCHSLVARSLGLKVDSITLFIFGGVRTWVPRPL